MEEKVHHTYGSSSAKYWSKCPAWASRMSVIPHEPAGKAADKGTALHYGVLEVKTKAEIEYRRTGKQVSIDYSSIPNWPAEGAEIADEFWHTLWTEVLEEIITGKVVWIEKKVMLFPDLDCGGTADVLVMYKDDKNKTVLVAGDLKTGRIQIDPSDEQLLFFCVGAYLNAMEKGVEIDEFRTFVFQPTAPEGERYKPHKFTKNQVIRTVEKYKKAILASKKDKPKPKAGDWCMYCKVQAGCPAYNKHLSAEMDLETIRTKDFPAVEDLSDETIRKFWMYSDKLKEYISQVNKYIIRRAIQGKPVEGLKIVAGVAKRRFKDQVKAEETLREYGINPMKESLMGITAVTAMLKNKGLKKEEIDAIMYEIAPRPPAPPKITIASDPKPELDISRPDLLGGYEEPEDSEIDV